MSFKFSKRLIVIMCNNSDFLGMVCLIYFSICKIPYPLGYVIFSKPLTNPYLLTLRVRIRVLLPKLRKLSIETRPIPVQTNPTDFQHGLHVATLVFVFQRIDFTFHFIQFRIRLELWINGHFIVLSI